ncbi:MAG TPA: hypothetical protein DCZ59_05760 [Bacteroidetes bacterium]|nr:hypothetical protein [Bacteroidota bacterium]
MATTPSHAVLRCIALTSLIVGCLMGLHAPQARATEPLLQTVVIESVRASIGTDTLTIFLRTASPLAQYQRPEKTPTGWLLRFPSASCTQTVVDSSARTEKVRCSIEQIRTFAVLRIATTLRDTLIVRRLGANELALLCVRRIAAPQAAVMQEPASSVATGGRWSLDVIVIDAGHGGKDVGAEGVNGAFEKDVTLAIARKLRDALRKELPMTKVVMTRETDEFIELYRRTEIANDAGGKLFMSIHCNSMPSKPHPAHGCETYILRPGRNDDAARVAQRENASVRFESSTKQYQTMTEDQIIVATMAQRSFVRFSESLASSIQSEVTGSCPLADRGVSQAGFFVLVGASMPNVLVETGFLSNTGDAQYLASPKGQSAISTALAKAISRYARDYQRTLNR